MRTIGTLITSTLRKMLHVIWFKTYLHQNKEYGKAVWSIELALPFITSHLIFYFWCILISYPYPLMLFIYSSYQPLVQTWSMTESPWHSGEENIKYSPPSAKRIVCITHTWQFATFYWLKFHKCRCILLHWNEHVLMSTRLLILNCQAEEILWLKHMNFSQLQIGVNIQQV